MDLKETRRTEKLHLRSRLQPMKLIEIRLIEIQRELESAGSRAAVNLF